MLEHRSTFPLLPILLACMLGHLNHSTNSIYGMTSHIIITLKICIQAVSVIMAWSMTKYNFVLTN